ncbi:MAG: hypothetical protein KDD43_00090 [Bdellovibrionales bacterium]|nr:hypothetical protein [Bdellovibrionales bacterium]
MKNNINNFGRGPDYDRIFDEIDSARSVSELKGIYEKAKQLQREGKLDVIDMSRILGRIRNDVHYEHGVPWSQVDFSKGLKITTAYKAMFGKKKFGILDMIGGVASGAAGGLRNDDRAIEQLELLAGAAMSASEAQSAIDRASGIMTGGLFITPDQKLRIRLAIGKMVDRISSRGVDISSLDIPFKIGSPRIGI